MSQDHSRRTSDRLARSLALARQASERFADVQPLVARRSPDVELDGQLLQSVIETSRTSNEGDSGRQRLRALKRWRETLVRRHALARDSETSKEPAPSLPPPVVAASTLPEATRLAEIVGGPERKELDLRGLTVAMNHAEVDKFVPDFQHYGPIRRRVARLLAKSSLFLSRFITARQRVVNSVLVAYTAESGDRLNAQRARVARLTCGVQRLVDEQRDATDLRLRELQAVSETHRRSVVELQQALHESDRLGGEHELRLSDAECETAWSRVAEIDQRQEILRLQQLLESVRGGLCEQGIQSDLLRQQIARSELELGKLGELIASQDELITVLESKADLLVGEIVAKVRALEEGLAALDLANEALVAERGREQASGEARAALPATDAGHLDSALDGLYVNLENQFRGPRELIRERLKSHMPLLLQTGAGAVDHPILDIGCGRGEWLELLSDRGLLARGVEINSVAVSNCRSLGLDVTAGDALDYLRRQSASEVAMVTAFHVLEHLPFGTLVELLGESLRVLEPGGVALFETPNPENVAVGANSFHFDPTHRRPLPPELMVFLMQQQGFSKVRVERQTDGRPDGHLERMEGSEPVAGRMNAVIDLLNRHFAAPSDYAVIGCKPR